MKKGIIIVVLIGIFMAGVSPAYAGRHPVYSHHHYPHWGLLGIGIITGAIVANLFYGPHVRMTRVEPAHPIVVQPSPVIVPRSHAPVYESTPGNNWLSVNTRILNVRSGPGMSFSIIGRVYQGDLLLTKGRALKWVYVRLPDGAFGWVMAKFTDPISSPASG